METKTDFLFLDPEITVDSDCRHEIKRCLLFGRKAMRNLDSMLKSRRYFADKGPYSQSKLCYFQYSCMDVTVGP